MRLSAIQLALLYLGIALLGLYSFYAESTKKRRPGKLIIKAITIAISFMLVAIYAERAYEQYSLVQRTFNQTPHY